MENWIAIIAYVVTYALRRYDNYNIIKFQLPRISWVDDTMYAVLDTHAKCDYYSVKTNKVFYISINLWTATINLSLMFLVFHLQIDCE